MATLLYRGQGKVWMGTRDASGNPQNLRWVGNCPEAKIGLELTTIEHKESWSGQNLTDSRLDTEKKASLSLTLESIQKENLQLCFRASIVSVSAGSAITAEVLGAGITTLAVGDLLKFAKRAATLVTIKDSTPTTPKTLVANVNDRLMSSCWNDRDPGHHHGWSFVGPLKAELHPGATTEAGLFTTGSIPYFFFIEGSTLSPATTPGRSESLQGADRSCEEVRPHPPTMT